MDFCAEMFPIFDLGFLLSSQSLAMNSSTLRVNDVFRNPIYLVAWKFHSTWLRRNMRITNVLKDSLNKHGLQVWGNFPPMYSNFLPQTVWSSDELCFVWTESSKVEKQGVFKTSRLTSLEQSLLWKLMFDNLHQRWFSQCFDVWKVRRKMIMNHMFKI